MLLGRRSAGCDAQAQAYVRTARSLTADDDEVRAALERALADARILDPALVQELQDGPARVPTPISGQGSAVTP